MPAHKRRAPETLESLGRRRSTRISSAGKKSRYFEADTDEDGIGEDLDQLDSVNGVNGRQQAKAAKAAKSAKSAKKATARRRLSGKKARLDTDEEDQYDENVPKAGDDEDEYDDSSDEDAPPKVTVIPFTKIRDEGGVAYEDERLHRNTMLFLKDLKANNKRSWLKSNDAEYRRSLQDWNTYVETFTPRIVAADPTIPELPIKDVVFRIYRDIRFSNDPTPYKPHYSVSFSRTGRKGPYACYYIHCEPGSCFVGGGLWHPDAGHLAKLRANIDERPRRWRRVLSEERFRTVFLPGVERGDEEGCVRAFSRANRENALKTRPKGFQADHQDIELLNLRNFTVGKKVPDSIFTAANSQDQIVEIMQAMAGFVSFLNDVVMPDPNLDSDSSSEDEDE